MIYIATVHVFTPRWANIQARYLEHYMQEPYQVYASFQGMAEVQPTGFTKTFTHFGYHAGKLNLLAAEIVHDAEPDDLIMFLDGDAFPITDPMPVVREALARTPVVAMQRAENLGDQQPHPAFCVMSVRTWRDILGDWSPGHQWLNEHGEPLSDVGGNLLRLLQLNDVGWTPLLRSNTVDIHPLWFGIYGGVIYHHGAGFRPAVSRFDLASMPKPRKEPPVPVVRKAVRYRNKQRERRWRYQKATQAKQLSESLIKDLEADFAFHERFTGAAPSPAGQ